MRVFCYDPAATPRAWGRAHGEAFRDLIRELAEIRAGLTLTLGKFKTRASLFEVAAAHLPVLRAYDGALAEELCGIADGAGLDPAAIVVLNHYTDLRDIDPKTLPDASGRAQASGAPRAAGASEAHEDYAGENEEGCSAVYVRPLSGPLLAQTWDMHGSAEPYVMMLGVPETAGPANERRPAAWLFTVAGCVGMTGLNDVGLGVTINNLRSLDARVGLVWPAFVRRLLHAPDATRAKALALAAPLGSGHHYFMASTGPAASSGTAAISAPSPEAFGVETSGSLRRVVYSGTSERFVHTNHCVDAAVAAQSAVPEGSTTFERYEALAQLPQDALTGKETLWRALGSHAGFPRSVCTHLATPERPHQSKTCGGMLMALADRTAWATSGCLNHAQPQSFRFTSGAPHVEASFRAR